MIPQWVYLVYPHLSWISILVFPFFVTRKTFRLKLESAHIMCVRLRNLTVIYMIAVIYLAESFWQWWPLLISLAVLVLLKVMNRAVTRMGLLDLEQHYFDYFKPILRKIQYIRNISLIDERDNDEFDDRGYPIRGLIYSVWEEKDYQLVEIGSILLVLVFGTDRRGKPQFNFDNFKNIGVFKSTLVSMSELKQFDGLCWHLYDNGEFIWCFDFNRMIALIDEFLVDYQETAPISRFVEFLKERHPEIQLGQED